MENHTSLWPKNLGNTRINLPKNILIEQARFLEEELKNILTVKVNTTQSTGAGAGDSKETLLVHEFVITAPNMGNYKFSLLRLAHGFDIYPLSVYHVITETSYAVKNENILIQVLTSIFNHEKTINVINSLIAQSS